MKNLKYIFLLFASLVFTACDDEDHGVDANNYNGTPVTYFTAGSTGNYFVTPNADVFTIQIGATNTSSTERIFNVVIDESSTAVEGVDYSLPFTNIVIPAGEYFGEIQVQGIFEGTTSEGSQLVLSINGGGVNEVMVNNSFTLDIVQKCISDLGGSYSVTTTYGYHDFLPSYSTNTMEVEISVIDQEAGLYEIFDFSGGLYSDGPYSSAYGTSDFVVQFTENCGQIGWTGQSDQWGACIPLDGGVNSVDLNTGVVTISWYCEAYGENGVSVYTPL
ncbi:hypothetical protein KH5_03050 [Urechidicola sp. KH5]